VSVLSNSIPTRGLRMAVRFAIAPDWARRIGLAGMGIIILAAVFAPLLTPYNPTALDMQTGLQGPSLHHIFGTDQLGRDFFTRVLYGARIDLLIGFGGVAIPLVAGVVIGLVTGYFGGWLDSVIGRIIDVVVAFPFLVLVIAIVAMLGPGLLNFFIAVSLVSWVAYARLVRAETLVAKNREYVLSARALGYSDPRIMFRHILPNVVAPALVFSMSDFVLDVLAGASLGFFGLGVPTPTPEWGVMIAEGRNFIVTAPWVVAFPGLAIIVLGFFASLIGDSFADTVRRIDAS
jgi:peptide/nickel transport system permease protein